MDMNYYGLFGCALAAFAVGFLVGWFLHRDRRNYLDKLNQRDPIMWDSGRGLSFKGENYSKMCTEWHFLDDLGPEASCRREFEHPVGRGEYHVDAYGNKWDY